MTKSINYNWATLSLITVMIALSGCGNKGSLYLPKEEPPATESMNKPTKAMQVDPASVVLSMPKNIHINPSV